MLAKALELPAPPPKRKDLAKNGQLKPAVKHATLAPRALDLSLPTDKAATPLVPGLGGGIVTRPPAALHEEKLLPALFDNKAKPASYQLGGRMISRERSDDLEGAEVQIQFRQ